MLGDAFRFPVRTADCPAQLPPPDTTPPSTPANLAVGSATASSIALTWTASTDNVGVSGYVVYRDGLPVATPGPTATTWTDNALVGSTLHRYRVAARDATGNESARSNEVVRTLADTVVLLRYFEALGEVRQAISVIKKRSGNHERTACNG